MKKLYSLKNILTLNFVLIASLSVLCIGAISLYILKNSMQEKITESNSLVAESLSNEISQFLKNPVDILKQIDLVINQNKLILSRDINRYLDSTIFNYKVFEMIRIVGRDGKIEYLTPCSEDLFLSDMSRQKYFQLQKKTPGTYWSETFLSMQTGQPTLTLSIPFNDGIIVGYINLAILDNLIKKIKIDNTGHAWVVDKKGVIIAHPNNALVSQRTIVKLDGIIQKTASGSEGTFEYFSPDSNHTDDTHYLWSAAIVPQTGWIVVVTQSNKEAFSNIRKLGITIVFITILSIVLAGFLAAQFLKSTLKPLKDLIEVTKEIGSGAYRDIAEQNTYKEINELYVTFSKMVDSIKSREKELQESEEKFRSFSEQSLVGIYLIEDSIFKYVNPKFAEIFGYTVEECLNDMPFHDLVHPDDIATVEEQVRKRAYGEAQSVQYTFRGIKKSGDIIHVEIFGSSISVKGESVVTGTMLDITDRKQAEEALRESEEKFKAVVEDTPVLICRFISEGIITFVNDTYCKYFDKSSDRLIGKCFLSFIPEADRKAVMTNLSSLTAESPVHTHEHRVIGPNSEICWQKWTNHAMFDEHGEVTAYQAIGEDITLLKKTEKEKLKLESQLQQSQKMESIGTLAGGIAHDFNNILFPIVGHTEMLLEDVPEDSPLRGSLDEIYTGSLRARDLVKQILAFSRQDSHEIKLMRMQPIIKDALKLIRSTIPTSIEIKQYIRKDCGIIKADPTQIHQVVMNLATNAYHAMEGNGGELKVSLKEVELGEQDVLHPDMEPGTYACLTMADTGVGMDKDLTGRIFDPFFTTKETGKGTGMGLSVVHGIVKNAGGSVHVYSEPGKGTEFHVYLPVVESSSEQQEIQPKEPIQRGTERILLVDDEEAIITMEKQMLERLGYQVVSRTSSVEALEAFRENPDKFDMVITDMAMPNMSGDRLASEVVKIRPNIPILLCTGFSERMPEEKAKSMGIKGFLMKPIVMKDLSNKIHEVLDNKESSGQE